MTLNRRYLFWSYLWGIEIKNERYRRRERSGVLILPMRDWNTLPTACTLFSAAVLILPMRDWNSSWSAPASCMAYRFDLTYEGLKYETPVEQNTTRKVLILPMRNCWLKAWFFVLYHSQLYKSPDKIPFIYFLKFFAFFPLFFLTFLCKISIISIFVLNFYKIIKFMKDSEKMCQSY